MNSDNTDEEFTLIIDFEDDESDFDEEPLFTATRLEGELSALRVSLRSNYIQLDNLRVQATLFDPALPPAIGSYIEEANELDIKCMIRSCEHRIRRLRAQIGNLNRKVVAAKRAEASGLNVPYVLNCEDRTLFVLGMGTDHCHTEVVKSTFKRYGYVEEVVMFKRHCLVKFFTKESAHKALVADGAKPLGRRIRVRPKLEPYAFSTIPVTIPWIESPQFYFPFTFCVPMSAFTTTTSAILC